MAKIRISKAHASSTAAKAKHHHHATTGLTHARDAYLAAKVRW
jgi:hypothetical protein